MSTETVRFYWSFRSPYAWLATLRVDEALRGLPVQLDWIPIYPPPDFPNDPARLPNKLKYIHQDVARFARAYGLPFQAPNEVDVDWKIPHCAYLFARRAGRGPDFLCEVFAARFERGENLGDPAVLGAAARASGVDAQGALEAHRDETIGGELMRGFQSAGQDGLFGVPTWVYRDQMFWGNDRVEWLADAIRAGA